MSIITHIPPSPPFRVLETLAMTWWLSMSTQRRFRDKCSQHALSASSDKGLTLKDRHTPCLCKKNIFVFKYSKKYSMSKPNDFISLLVLQFLIITIISKVQILKKYWALYKEQEWVDNLICKKSEHFLYYIYKFF